MQMNGRKGNATVAIWAIVLLVACGIGILGYYVLKVAPAQTTIIPPAGAGVIPSTGAECLSTTTPQITFDCNDLANKGTAVAADIVYKTNGGAIQIANCDEAVNFNKYDEVEFVINKTGWYTLHSDATEVATVEAELSPDKQILLTADGKNGKIEGNQYIVPCEEKATVNIYLKQHATGTTLQFFCEDDNELNTVTVTESIAAGENPKIEVKIIGQVDRYVQDPTITVDYNKSAFDTADWMFGVYPTITTPQHFASNYSSVRNADRTWEINDHTNIKPGDVLNFYMALDAAASADPTTIIADSDMVFTLGDADWYINEKAGTFQYGRDDENGADVGIGTQVNTSFWVG